MLDFYSIWIYIKLKSTAHLIPKSILNTISFKTDLPAKNGHIASNAEAKSTAVLEKKHWMHKITQVTIIFIESINWIQ